MSKTIGIMHEELKCQMSKLGTWVLLAVGVGIALMDNFPSKKNFNRLPYLSEQSYVVNRLVSQTSLIIMLALIFFIATRIYNDKINSYNELIIVTTLKKSEYILGKFIGNYIYVLIVMALFLGLNFGVQYFYNPYPCSIIPYFQVYIINVLPMSFFIVGLSLSLPLLIDIRVYYIITIFYFLINIMIVPDNGVNYFYMLSGGEMLKLLYQFGNGSVFLGHITSYFFFMIGSGLAAVLILFTFNNYWRHKNV